MFGKHFFFFLVGFAIIKIKALLYVAFEEILIWVAGSSCGMLVLSRTPALWCLKVWYFQNCLDLILRNPPVVVPRLPGRGTAHQLGQPRLQPALFSEVVWKYGSVLFSKLV